MSDRKGIFITISGIDGSGKTTIQKWIKEITSKYTTNEVLLVDGLKPLIYTNKLKENAKGNIFETYGDICLLTYCLSLIRNLVTLIEPALNAGKIVIAHRDDLCCRAYTMLRDKDHTVMPIVEKVLENYISKDLHFYCDIDVDTALSRIDKRIENGYIPSINENRGCLTQLLKNYEELLKNEKSVIRLDTRNVTLQDIDRIIAEYFEERR